MALTTAKKIVTQTITGIFDIVVQSTNELEQSLGLVAVDDDDDVSNEFEDD